MRGHRAVAKRCPFCEPPIAACCPPCLAQWVQRKLSPSRRSWHAFAFVLYSSAKHVPCRLLYLLFPLIFFFSPFLPLPFPSSPTVQPRHEDGGQSTGPEQVGLAVTGSSLVKCQAGVPPYQSRPRTVPGAPDPDTCSDPIGTSSFCLTCCSRTLATVQ